MTRADKEKIVILALPANCMSNLYFKVLQGGLTSATHDEIVELINTMMLEGKVVRQGRMFTKP